MARRSDEIEDLLKDLNKFTPQGSAKPIAQRGSDLERIRAIPCFSPALAYLLSVGGWPEGKLIEFFGKEHSGKSSFALMALKDCYDYYQGEKMVAYIDLEHRFNPEWAEKLGLPVNDSLIVVQPPDAESGTDIMVHLIKSKKICAIVWDSTGAAATKHSMMEVTEKNDKMGGNAPVMKRNVQTVAPLANLYNVTCFYLNQLRQDMGGYNRPMTPGGNAVKHAMSVRIYLRPGNDKYFDKINGEDIQVGFPIVMKTVKNSYGPPFREGWTDFYNQPNVYLDHAGIDTQRDLARMGILLGVAQRQGAWFQWDDIRAQGRDTFFKQIWDSGRAKEFEGQIIKAMQQGVNKIEIIEDDELLERPVTNESEDIHDSEV
jgi:recombination protein RecA